MPTRTMDRILRGGLGLALGALLLGGCSMAGLPALKPQPGKSVAAAVTAPEPGPAPAAPNVAPLAYAGGAGDPALNALIRKYAGVYDVPESLVHRVVRRESTYNPAARNGPYWGLMQIRHDTAQTMGYRGSAAGLLDAETNLKYAVKYLRGAYMVGGYSEDAAVRFYSRGYYYDAKRQGLLEATGLR